MANSLLTISMITREAVMLFRNSNSFIRNIDTQYDDQFALTGAKIGTSLRIRLPNDYTVRTGQAASIQDTSEVSTTLALATQMGVDMAFSSVDRTMSLDDFSERILAPAINNLAGGVATTIMAGVEGGVCNLVQNTDNANNILSPVAGTYLSAGASLNVNSAPLGRRKVINDPFTEARTVTSLAGLFNPQSDIAKQYRTGSMQQALGFDWFMDQTVIKHTSGSFTAGTVNGAAQTGQTVVTNAITGTLNAGDIVTITGVNAVNRVNKQTTGQLRQFVVTANALNGAVSLSLYPAIIPGSGTYNPTTGAGAVQYQTVTASPADAAPILLVTLPSVTYRKNIAYAPECVTMATADLELPRNVQEAARETYDGISIRMVSQYDIKSDEFITRIDVLFGYLFVRPEWGVVIPDTL